MDNSFANNFIDNKTLSINNSVTFRTANGHKVEMSKQKIDAVVSKLWSDCEDLKEFGKMTNKIENLVKKDKKENKQFGTNKQPFDYPKNPSFNYTKNPYFGRRESHLKAKPIAKKSVSEDFQDSDDEWGNDEDDQLLLESAKIVTDNQPKPNVSFKPEPKFMQFNITRKRSLFEPIVSQPPKKYKSSY